MRRDVGIWLGVVFTAVLLLAQPMGSAQTTFFRCFWKAIGQHIYNANSGNVGIGTGAVVPAQKLEVVGSIKVSGSGSGLVFPDGTTQTTAVAGGGAGIPSSFSILGDTSTAPSGYTFTGRVLDVGNTWTLKAPLPAFTVTNPEQVGGVVSVNNKVYVVGRKTSGGPWAGNVDEYDPATNTWATKSPMPVVQSFFAVAVANNKIYTIGGCTQNDCSLVVGTVQEYDPASDVWTTKSSMPTAGDGLQFL